MSRRKERKLIRQLSALLVFSIVVLILVLLVYVITEINENRNFVITDKTTSENLEDIMPQEKTSIEDNSFEESSVNNDVAEEREQEVIGHVTKPDYSHFPYESSLVSPQDIFAGKNYENHQIMEDIVVKYATPEGMTDEEWYKVNPLAIPIGEYKSGKNDAKMNYSQWYKKKVAWYGDSVTE